MNYTHTGGRHHDGSKEPILEGGNVLPEMGMALASGMSQQVLKEAEPKVRLLEHLKHDTNDVTTQHQ